MFIGHFGLALASKRLTPRVNLGWSLLAAQTLDTLWPVLVLSGVESVAIKPGLVAANPLAFEHYPYSHSLLIAAVWGLLFGGAAKLLGRSLKEAVVLGLLVLSHWFLDLLVHVPDLPLGLSEGPKLGLGLWASIPYSIALELGALLLGSWAYFSQTRAKDAIGRWSLPALLALLTVIQLASYFGPPPPSPQAVAVSALGMGLFFVWGAWGDRHRERR